jgi:hypothetical protein
MAAWVRDGPFLQARHRRGTLPRFVLIPWCWFRSNIVPLLCDERPTTTAETPTVADLQQKLRSSPYLSLRQIDCDLDQGQVILLGTVPSYYLKQIAEAVAVRTIGDYRLQSLLVVQTEQHSA